HWVGQHTDLNWVKLAKFDLQVEEKFDTLPTDESTTINAFFQDDSRPLDRLEIGQAVLIHAWQRQDLLETVKNLTPDLMTRMLPGQRWNINGILNHIGRTETRYLAYLDLPLPTAELLVHNPFKILELSYELVQKYLPELTGSTAILEHDGEFWSARKLVRCLLWHQRDHCKQIQQIVEMANM
ncbi:MAG TPA: DinB family protein, partial [Anaerolineaceae bacterium]|nr:DinB family protein [Anaerolineaceae bacterium]